MPTLDYHVQFCAVCIAPKKDMAQYALLINGSNLNCYICKKCANNPIIACIKTISDNVKETNKTLAAMKSYVDPIILPNN